MCDYEMLSLGDSVIGTYYDYRFKRTTVEYNLRIASVWNPAAPDELQQGGLELQTEGEYRAYSQKDPELNWRLDWTSQKPKD